MTAVTPLVCERCSIYHPCHPDSSKKGGVILHMDREDRLCVVCVDWLDQEGPEDLPDMTLSQRPTGATQRTLGGY